MVNRCLFDEDASKRSIIDFFSFLQLGRRQIFVSTKATDRTVSAETSPTKATICEDSADAKSAKFNANSLPIQPSRSKKTVL